MDRTTAEPVAVAVFARAPQPGAAKTRLIPVIGERAAARLHRRMTLHALVVAHSADVGPVSLWVTPDAEHRFFHAVRRRFPTTVRPQPGGHLGERMATVIEDACRTASACILIGSDCPSLAPQHLRVAAAELHGGRDAVFITAEDGGYVLVGMRRPRPEIFEAVDWGSERVMSQTRRLLADNQLSWAEPFQLWDLDRPKDLERLQREGFAATGCERSKGHPDRRGGKVDAGDRRGHPAGGNGTAKSR